MCSKSWLRSWLKILLKILSRCLGISNVVWPCFTNFSRYIMIYRFHLPWTTIKARYKQEHDNAARKLERFYICRMYFNASFFRTEWRTNYLLFLFNHLAPGSCSKASGYFPDPSDCTKFIICAGKKTFYQNCPPGLLFNKNKRLCDWPHNVKC